MPISRHQSTLTSPLEEWVEYLKNGVISPETQAPGLQEAREKLKYYSMSDAERYAYDEHINAIMIQNDVLGNARLEGMEEGRAEGRTEEKNNIARKMLANGLSIEQIALITGLTEQEIKRL
jgi:predicted transposase/invertase (TIGR01784 family)